MGPVRECRPGPRISGSFETWLQGSGLWMPKLCLLVFETMSFVDALNRALTPVGFWFLGCSLESPDKPDPRKAENGLQKRHALDHSAVPN